MKAILNLHPKTHEQRDNHKPGCWIASLVTTHQKCSKDVVARYGKVQK